MRTIMFLPLALTLATAGAATADKHGDYDAKLAAEHQAKIDKALQGLHEVGQQSCINLHDATDTVRAGDTIIYKAGGHTAYVNHTSGGCFGLDNGDAIITHTYSDRLCRGDIAHTVDLQVHIQSGSCSLGDFTVYRSK